MLTRRAFATLTLALLTAAPAGAVPPDLVATPARTCAGSTAPRPCATWAAHLPAGTVVASAAAPDGRVVYHATRVEGAARLRLTAHDSRTGAARWSRDLPGDGTGYAELSATATRVHAVVQPDRAMAGARRGDVAVVALDAGTGAVRARTTYPLGTARLLRSAVTADGTVLVAAVTRAGRQSLVAHYVERGRALWAVTLPRQELPGPVVVSNDGTVAYLTGDRWGGDAVQSSVVAVALRATAQPIRWRRDLAPNSTPNAALLARDGRTLYVAVDVVADPVAERAYGLYALDAATGRVAWTRTLPRGAAAGVAVGTPPDPPAVYVGYVGATLVRSATTDDVYAVLTTSPYAADLPYDSYAVVRVTKAGAVAWVTDVTASSAGAAVADPAGEGVLVAGRTAAGAAAGAGGVAAGITRVAGDGTLRSVSLVGTDAPAADWHVDRVTVAGERVVVAGRLGAPHASPAPGRATLYVAGYPAG